MCSLPIGWKRDPAPAPACSVRARERVAKGGYHCVDLRPLDDERGRQGDDVAGHEDQQHLFETIDENVIGPRAHRTLPGPKLDARDEPDGAAVVELRGILQRLVRAWTSAVWGKCRVVLV